MFRKATIIANKIVIVMHIFERSLYVSHGLLILKLHSCLEDQEHEKKKKHKKTYFTTCSPKSHFTILSTYIKLKPLNRAQGGTQSRNKEDTTFILFYSALSPQCFPSRRNYITENKCSKWYKLP